MSGGDCPGGNVVTRILTSGREVEKENQQDGSVRGLNSTPLALETEEEGHKSVSVSSLEKLQEARKGFPPRAPRRNTALPTPRHLDFTPVRPVLNSASPAL